VAANATAILFTCSAFGAIIEGLKRKYSIPILTPNEALFEEVIERGGKVALLTTFAPSIPALTDELNEMLVSRGGTLDIEAMLVDGAFDALLAGDQAMHDQIIADKVATLKGYNTIVFGQFSMASASAQAQKLSSVPVLTTPDCAVRKLKKLLIGAE
jgi:Asp/Glu/hydantoin racemase